MADRSIGEALEELREAFPDVSVSKIRFLESQGLISPKRTPSGYRQFSDDDVELLRWILIQQREHYLPLKVIRRRLREGHGPPVTPAPAPVGDTAAGTPPPAEPGVPAEASSWSLPGGHPRAPGDEEPEPRGEKGSAGRWESEPGVRIYTRAELARAAGIEEKAVSELESFGLLPGQLDDEALRVARLAAGFFAYGVEARHLRMYKTFAEREAAFLEQVVMPMVNPRRPGSPAQAREALAELTRLGQALRQSMLRLALDPPPGD